MLVAGLPARIIRQALPCANGRPGLRACPGALARRAIELAEARMLLEQTIASAGGA